MTVKKIFPLLLLAVILCSSCSYASVTPEQALADQRIGPAVDFTIKNGASYLPGRYAHLKDTQLRVGSQKVLAPSSMILEVMQFNSENNTYPANVDVYGEDLEPAYITFDTSGTVPILRLYAADDNGEYITVAECYAVVLTQGNNYAWCIASIETGEIRYLYPINQGWFPAGWYSGTWKSDNNHIIALSGDKFIGQGVEIGPFIVSDNRIIIKTPDNNRISLNAMKNLENDTLVVTFNDGHDGTKESAEVFKRSTEPQPPAKTLPKFPAPSPTPKAPKFRAPSPSQPAQPKSEPQSPKMPQTFPEMPKVNMPPQTPAINLEGVWGAYVNGQQWVIQYQGNQYYGWINGQPSEMGIFQLQGNTITGMNNNGVNFTATVQLDPAGQYLNMMFPNGNTIRYQKVK